MEKRYCHTKLTKFLNTCAAGGGQADNHFPEMELFSMKEGLSNQLREVP